MQPPTPARHGLLPAPVPGAAWLALVVVVLTGTTPKPVVAAGDHAAIKGRYVRIELPGPDAGLLNFAELQVFDPDDRNLAPHGAVAASSHRRDPAIAVDGDTSGDGEGFHSAAEPNPWCEIDLGRVQTITRLVLWPRRSMHARLDGALLTVLDDHRRVVWHQRLLRGSPAAMEFPVGAFDGRHVGRTVAQDQQPWYDTTREQPGEYRMFPPAVEAFDPAGRDIHELPIEPPADAGQRRRQFDARESDAAAADLARRLHAAIDAGHEDAGLHEFHQLMADGDHRGALEAYRDYFFNRGAPGFPELFVNLPAANEFTTQSLMDHRRVEFNGDQLIRGAIGAPGAAAWAPRAEVPEGAYWGRLAGGVAPDDFGNRHPFWRTDEGRGLIRQIEFFTETRGPHFGRFDDLLAYYLATGSRPHLEKWMDYLDDWCLFGRADLHRSPLGLLWATDHSATLVPRRLGVLHAANAARPEFSRQIRPTTLARYLLALIEELPPHTIRSTRTQLANWGTLSKTGGLLQLRRLTPEFHAVQYYGREGWRLWQAEWIHRNSPDGSVAENLRGPYRNVALVAFPLDYRDLAGNDLEWREMLDNARRILRHNIGETPQTGTGFWHRDNRHWLDQMRDPVFDEPEIRARLQRFDRQPGDEPGVTSELMPYGGKFVLRDSWNADGRFFKMRAFVESSQDPLLRTEYSLGWADRDLANEPLPSSGGGLHYEAGPLYALPLLVDRRGPHPRHDALSPVGGKTEYLARAPDRVIDTRFHTSERFDLAEARQDAPYAFRRHWTSYWLPRSSHAHFVHGPHIRRLAEQDDAPVTGVVAWRRVLAVRGTGLYIVTDRVEATGDHEYARPLHLGLALDDETLAGLAAAGQPPVRISRGGRRVDTALDGLRNLTLYFFGPDDLVFFNRFDRDGNFTTTDDYPANYPLGVKWQGRGNQLLVSLHHARDPGQAPISGVEPFIFIGADGGTGFNATLDDGSHISYRAGPQPVNPLRAGDAAVQAESLLLVRTGDHRHGVVIGAESALEIGGHRLQPDAASYEFSLTNEGTPAITPIHRPIDRVHILPGQTAFTDQIRLRFDIPTQSTADIDFRYTTDGSDPTIDSHLYNGPVTLEQTTLVKVRAFRRGLDHTPYRQAGTASSETFHALFTRQPLRQAEPAGATEPGLSWQYQKDDIWTRLFAHAGIDGMLDISARGSAAALLDPHEVGAIRDTDGPYAITWRGWLQVPADGIYAFHAPDHLHDVTRDAGFNLRVFVAGEEWSPSARLHAEGTWQLPLQAGAHRFEVRFVDYRHRQWRNPWWMIGREEITWQGIPALEVSGPEFRRQPVPAGWLRRPADD